MSVFRFKHFDVKQEKNPLKVGTDSMLLGALIEASTHKRALDLGAGTGVLSLMIAQKNPIITIDAIEINQDGMMECQGNFATSPWTARLKVFLGNYFEYQFQGSYDLIFSNPPFYFDGLLANKEEDIQAKHTNNQEVVLFLKQVNSLLSAHGKFWVIIPFSSLNFFLINAKKNDLNPVEVISIHGKVTKKNKRVVVCFQKKRIKNIINRELIIRDESNEYTEEYKILTKDFHWELF